MRRLLALCRRWWPILVVNRPLLGIVLGILRLVPRVVVVTRHSDVVEVLARNRDFTVALYDLRMRSVLGPFFLGRDDGEAYRRESSIARLAIRPGDRDRIQRFCEKESRRIVEEAARSRSRIDVVAELANVVPVAFVGDYFGIPEPTPQAPTLLTWFQTASYYMFNLEFLTGPPLAVAAARAGAAIGSLIDGRIEARHEAEKRKEPASDDILERFLTLQRDPETRLDDGRIRDTLAGIISGTLVPTIGLFCDAVNRLMDLPPDELARLHAAARDGDGGRVGRYVREAARFAPFPPVLYRYCEHETVLAGGTPREKRIPAGAIVVAVTASAAFDEEVVDGPEEFRIDRPEEQYLLFGHGQHACLGASPERPIAQVLMTEMTTALFARPGVRRAAGAAGRLRKRRGDDVPPSCPESLVLELD